MIVVKDEGTLSTGRTFYTNHGIIGLSAETGEFGKVHEGYDGGIYTDEWTPKERRELAQYMVELWTAWLLKNG